MGAARSFSRRCRVGCWIFPSPRAELADMAPQDAASGHVGWMFSLMFMSTAGTFPNFAAWVFPKETPVVKVSRKLLDSNDLVFLMW